MTEQAQPSGEGAVPFDEAFRYWVRLGFVNFGGPAGQIAMMQRDLVDQKKWISQDRFLHALSYCMLLPGPEAQQLAIYIGWLLHGTWGGVVAGAFFVIPSIFILWGLTAIYAAYGSVAAIAGTFAGLKAAVVALVIVAVFRISRRALRPRGLAVIAAAAFVGIYLVHVSFPAIVLGAGLIGFLAGRIWPVPFRRARADAESMDRDALPTQSMARIQKSRRSGMRGIRLLALGFVLWSAPYAALVLWRGWSSRPALEYRFFTQAAFVTFGGAYAVLAYVMQEVVQSNHWITHAQAIDGMGLAETTPGPLIMVLQFIGFMSAWNQPEGMSRLAAGTLGALVTTYVTFLPCFFYIFLGAPYIEGLRGNRSLTAALSGITAAVVGVILNLALVFGLAVLFPGGWGHPPNWLAFGLSGCAFVALFFFRLEAIWVVLAAGGVGLVGTVIGW